MGQEYFIHCDHARLKQRHLVLYPVIEDRPGGPYSLPAAGLWRRHHDPLLGKREEHRVSVAGKSKSDPPQVRARNKSPKPTGLLVTVVDE